MTDNRAQRPGQTGKVLFATLTECTSGRGSTYLRGWAGASNLVAFRGEDDEHGRPTWQLFLVERPPRAGASAAAHGSQGGRTPPGRPYRRQG